jgi:hypothetical protein
MLKRMASCKIFQIKYANMLEHNMFPLNVNSLKKCMDWVLKNTLTSEVGFPSC